MSTYFSKPHEFCAGPFDFLIAGGGTAGLVLATRLSENPHIRVGVIEAGPAVFEDPIIDTPGRFGESLGGKYDWQFETVPQAGLGGRTLKWPRGKVLGGSSALNFMTWNRGNREDYDAWEELGNDGWGWDGLLPYFKKSESFREPSIEHQSEHSSYFNRDDHGVDGPLQTSYSTEFGASHQHWHSTLKNLGVQTNKKHFSGSNVGVWTSIGAVDPESRTRSYSAVAYYRPNAARPNLVVLPEAVAREIVLERDGDGWKATGVKFTSGGQNFQALASREVVLCAGSVQSPQLLELSGIGNPEILQGAGITVKVSNCNVGENLQDHIMTAMVYEILPSIASPESLRSDLALARAAEAEYHSSQSGVLTAIPSSIAYLPLSHFMSPAAVGSLYSQAASLKDPTPSTTILARQFTSTIPLGQIEFNFDVSNYSPYYKSELDKKYGTMLQMLQYPFSRGSIHLRPMRSSSPTTFDDKPIINPQYYVGPRGSIDFEVMVAAQYFAHKICSTPPLSSIVLKRAFPPPPADGAEDNPSDLAFWVSNYTITDWHPVGTCAMGGTAGAASGVVDARLRVYGVRGLRVVDASIMPLQISAHLQATVYAIAEKGASLILEDFKAATSQVGGGVDEVGVK